MKRSTKISEEFLINSGAALKLTLPNARKNDNEAPFLKVNVAKQVSHCVARMPTAGTISGGGLQALCSQLHAHTHPCEVNDDGGVNDEEDRTASRAISADIARSTTDRMLVARPASHRAHSTSTLTYGKAANQQSMECNSATALNQ